MDQSIINFKVYEDSVEYVGMAQATLPDLTALTQSISGAGIAGNVESVILGHFDAMTLGLNFRTVTDQSVKLSEPRRHTIDLRVAQQDEDVVAGKVVVRARTEFEEFGQNRQRIIVTELPYQVNKAQLMRKIAEMREEKKEELACVDYVADESDRSGMRAVIRVKKDADIPALLAYLYKYTDLEVTFGINMVVIADGKPQQLGLMEIIRHYVKYQQQVILRRTLFDLHQAEQRCHILEGLIIAVRNIDEVIAIIKKSESTSDARSKLMARFELTEVQAQAILDLRLARLTKLEVFKLEEELKELKKLIKKLTAISKSGELQLQVVKEEITEIKDKYPSPRHSRLVFDAEEANALLAHASEKQPGAACTLVYTADDRFKVLTGKQTDALGKSLDGKFKPQLIVSKLLKTITDRKIFAFTNFGNCHKLDIYSPDYECRLADAGISLQDLSKDAEEGEKVVAIFEIGERFPIGNLMFFPRKGMIKKSEWSEYDNQRKDCFLAVKLAEGDEVIAVELSLIHI